MRIPGIQIASIKKTRKNEMDIYRPRNGVVDKFMQNS